MENYFMNYDGKTGEIKGFYLLSMHGFDIPKPNIEITEQKHDFYMENNGLYKLNPQTLEDELITYVPVAATPTEDQLRIAAIEGAIMMLM